jgi:hypothetical protein
MEAIMNQERDRFLVEKMGECWHEWDPEKGINTYSLEAYVCERCKGFILGNRDFSTEEDFRILMQWARTQPALENICAALTDSQNREAATRSEIADFLYARLKQA